MTALLAFLAISGTLVVLPVYAAPLPEAEPVSTSSTEVAMGSLEEPAPAADVQEGTTDPVVGVAEDAPTLTIRKTPVPEFSLVGVTWAHDPAVADTVVQVRVQDAAGAWGPWTEVEPETADQGATVDTGAELRSGTAPLWTGPSIGAEVELVTRSGTQPTDVRLDLIDPGTSAADASLTAPAVEGTAHAALSMPDVHSRAQWGADESLRTWKPQYAATIKAATLHHTADSNSYTADQVPAILRSIYRYHTVSLGWGDIGYNVIVDKFGRLFEGRYGGLQSTVVGAHAGGFNTATFGVSMLGNYDTAATTPAMVDAVAAIIAWKFSLYGVDPRGTTVLTSSGGGTSRYKAGSKVTLPTIFGHRDVGSTACPGRYGYVQLGAIRTKVTARLQAAAPVQTISSRYASEPALQQALGSPVGAEQSQDGVVWQVYRNGRLYSSPGTGVHLVWGAVLARYLAAGGPPALGAPTSDELGTPDGVGRYNLFAKAASVYWTPQHGAQVVWGGVREEWQRTGWETGPLGYPTGGEEVISRRRGTYQQFERGTVYWSPATGAHEVHGSIAAVWRSRGGVDSPLGLPTSGEMETPDGQGRYNHFANGASIYYAPSTGVRVVWGGVREVWARLRWESGPLGYPRTDEALTAAGDGTQQQFDGGGVYWTPVTGAHEVHGVIGQAYLAAGGDKALGVPISDELRAPDGVGYYNHLAKGASIYFTPATGAHVVGGSVRDVWGALGWERGVLGYPTTGETASAVSGARVTAFTGGRVYRSSKTGTRAVFGAIGAEYLRRGAEASWLGLPTSDEYRVKGGIRQAFQGGTVTVVLATGRMVVARR
nr:N-acetylmuramoyl-L-alanine amidase [Modestobacter marinus]